MHFPMIYNRVPYEDDCALLERVTLWDVALERQTLLKGPGEAMDVKNNKRVWLILNTVLFWTGYLFCVFAWKIILG